MNIFKISFANLKFRSLSSFFNIIILSLGISLITTTLYLSNLLENKFNNDVQEIDLVVGAKGSPMQLILSAIFHLDVPTGNIELEKAEEIAKNSLVKLAIPLALGDNYQGFRIVGTDENYIKHYNGEFASGNFSQEKMDVVLGSEIAKINNLKIGDKIIGAHGISDSDDLHSDSPYIVSGILKETNSVLDKLIITKVESIWHVHHEDETDHKASHHHNEDKDAEKEITNLLITYKTPLAALSLPRQINEHSNLQAASPAFEIARLVRIFGVGIEAAKIFALILIIVAAIGFFVTLFNSLNERSYDIALMRSLGASKMKIVKLLLSESLILGFLGAFIGIILSHISVFCLQNYLHKTKNLSLHFSFEFWELYVILGALLVSLISAAIPTIIAYKVNVSKTLSRNK